MKPVWWMVGSSLLPWLAVSAWPAFEPDREVLFGMAGPLAAAVVTWVLVATTFASRPERVTPLMIVAFGAKMVFFGAYVTVMLTVLSLQPVPFAISFTLYLIALYAMEALFLQRLFAHGRPASR